MTEKVAPEAAEKLVRAAQDPPKPKATEVAAETAPDPVAADLEKILEGDLSDTPVKEPENKSAEQTTPKKEAPPEPKLTPVSVVIEKMDEAMEASAAAPPTREEGAVKKRIRKRKSRRAADKPRFPLTGYVRYISERREGLKAENPDATHLDIIKKLGDEWSKLPEEQKKPYMEEAEKDRKRYLVEMKQYKVAHPEEALPKPRKKKKKMTEEKPPPEQPEPVEPVTAVPEPAPVENGETRKPSQGLKPGQIAIFTDEFLEHNKHVETQLKTLRKANTDFEFNNSNLERYIENMRTGIGNMESDLNIWRNKNEILEKYLVRTRAALATAFGSISLPTEKTASVGNIEKYLTELAGMNGPASTVNKAKDVLRKLDLQALSN